MVWNESYAMQLSLQTSKALDAQSFLYQVALESLTTCTHSPVYLLYAFIHMRAAFVDNAIDANKW